MGLFHLVYQPFLRKGVIMKSRAKFILVGQEDAHRRRCQAQQLQKPFGFGQLGLFDSGTCLLLVSSFYLAPIPRSMTLRASTVDSGHRAKCRILTRAHAPRDQRDAKLHLSHDWVPPRNLHTILAHPEILLICSKFDANFFEVIFSTSNKVGRLKANCHFDMTLVFQIPWGSVFGPRKFLLRLGF